MFSFRRSLASCLLVAALIVVGGCAHEPGRVSPAPAAAPEQASDRALADLLLGEIALQRALPQEAVAYFSSAAQESGDGRVAARAWATANAMGDTKLMESTLDIWNSIDPLNDRAAMETIVAEAKKGNWDEARDTMMALLKKSRRPVVMVKAINSMIASLPEKKKVYSLVKDATINLASEPEVQIELAKAARQAGFSRQAIAHAEDATRLDPDTPEVVVGAADVIYGIDRHRASHMLHDYVLKNPLEGQVRLSYAKSLLGVGHKSSAYKELTAIDQFFHDDPSIQFGLGMVAEEGGFLELAQSRYLRVLWLLARSNDPRMQPDDCYVRLGMVALARNQTTQAEEWLSKVQHGDKYFAARVKLAEIYASSHRIDQACYELKSVRTTDRRKKADLYEACAELLFRANRREEGLKTFGEAIKVDPTDASLLYKVAAVAGDMGFTAQAEQYFRQYIQLRPQDAQGYNALGYMWADRNVNLMQADALLQKAMQLSGGMDSFILDSIGWLRYRQGKLDEAEMYLRKSFKARPEIDIALHLAEVLFAQKKNAEAEKLVRRVLQANQDNAEALQLLKAHGITP